jgi:hypothetical protein
VSYAENTLPAVLPQVNQTDDLVKALAVTPQQGTAPIALPEARQLEIKENGDPLEPYFNGFDEGRTGESVAEAAGQSGAQVQGAALDAAGVRQDADVSATLSGQRTGELAEGAGDVLKTDDIISVYRGVGPNEYDSVVASGKFDTVPTGMEVKQFGLDKQDTINFAKRYPDIAAILEVKIPKDILHKIGDFTKVDTTIFKNGTVTIQPENLDTFNKYIKEILHIH